MPVPKSNKRQLTVISTSLVLLIVQTLAGKPAVAEAIPVLTDKALVIALRAGGYNLYFRHVATDWSQSDNVQKSGDWLSCDARHMRQLSDTGRAAAVAIGEAIRALDIPVGKVLASPYCRTVETARLMKLGVVIPTTEVMNLRSAEYFGGRSAIVASAQALLATPPAPRVNTVIVAHGNVAREATPVYPGEGDAIVFQPDGMGNFRYIGEITPVDWPRIMETMLD